MPRRVSLPGAAELFRPTHTPAALEPTTPAAVPAPTPEAVPAPTPEAVPAPTADSTPAAAREARSARSTRAPSGRVRHEEKITVYVSADELVALEQARLTLRARYGLAADRGRIVREAVSALIADLDARGPESELVRRVGGG